MDDIRTPPNPLGRLLTYTTIITLVNNSESTTNRCTAGSVECDMLGGQYAWCCV
jgi:hypothetical protein